MKIRVFCSIPAWSNSSFLRRNVILGKSPKSSRSYNDDSEEASSQMQLHLAGGTQRRPEDTLQSGGRDHGGREGAERLYHGEDPRHTL